MPRRASHASKGPGMEPLNRRTFAALTVTVLAFRAVATFLSWVEHQDESVADTWVDEDEFEDA